MPPLEILWRDEHLVAVFKPAGWLVHRTGLDAGETRFVLQALRDQLGLHVFPAHRLDKGTCGVLLFALSPGVARSLTEAFTGRAVRKHYLALVRGWMPPSADVDHALRPDDAPADSPPQNAHTRLHRLARLELPGAADPRFPTTRASLVEAIPTTGRRHQIRRHLKHLAHPIVGDATHGKGPLNRWWAHRLGIQRLWLHALRIELTHPVSGQALSIDSGVGVPPGPGFAQPAPRGQAIVPPPEGVTGSRAGPGPSATPETRGDVAGCQTSPNPDVEAWQWLLSLGEWRFDPPPEESGPARGDAATDPTVGNAGLTVPGGGPDVNPSATPPG